MTNDELNTALYDRLLDEQKEWRQWLLSQSPGEILNHAYEYTSREDSRGVSYYKKDRENFTVFPIFFCDPLRI